MHSKIKYPILKELLNDLNTDTSHFFNSNDICTPMECVEEMLDRIPTEFWQRDGVDVLDPCAGNGNFPAYVLEKFRQHDNSTYNLYANEINPKRISNLQELFSGANLLTQDFFEFDEDKKYDLIVANPPYAKIDKHNVRAAKNHNLSRGFVVKALSLLNDNGYLVFIIPDNWMSLSDRNDVVELLSEHQFIHLNIHGAKKYFKKVGSSFTWFVVKKTPNTTSFVVENFYRKEETNQATLDVGMRNIPLFYNFMVKSIIDKTLTPNNTKIPVETSSNLHKYTKKKLLHTRMMDDFAYKVHHTQKQTVWSKVPHKFQEGWKVFISLTSYYSTFIDDCGMTQSIGFVQCKDHDEAVMIKKVLDHPLYVFINNLHRYGNFNNIRILQKFPYPDDVDNIWESFNITKEEIDFINEYNSLKNETRRLHNRSGRIR